MAVKWFWTVAFFSEKGRSEERPFSEKKATVIASNEKTLGHLAEGFWFSSGSETAYVVGTDRIVFSTRETIL